MACTVASWSCSATWRTIPFRVCRFTNGPFSHVNHALDPAERDAVKADYAGLRALGRARPTGFFFEHNDFSALDVTQEERTRLYEKYWGNGGLTFLGVFGIHRFYMGKILTGILYLLTGGLLLIGVVYDFVTLNDQLNVLNRQRTSSTAES